MEAVRARSPSGTVSFSLSGDATHGLWWPMAAGLPTARCGRGSLRTSSASFLIRRRRCPAKRSKFGVLPLGSPSRTPLRTSQSEIAVYDEVAAQQTYDIAHPAAGSPPPLAQTIHHGRTPQAGLEAEPAGRHGVQPSKSALPGRTPSFQPDHRKMPRPPRIPGPIRDGPAGPTVSTSTAKTEASGSSGVSGAITDAAGNAIGESNLVRGPFGIRYKGPVGSSGGATSPSDVAALVAELQQMRQRMDRLEREAWCTTADSRQSRS